MPQVLCGLAYDHLRTAVTLIHVHISDCLPGRCCLEMFQSHSKLLFAACTWVPTSRAMQQTRECMAGSFGLGVGRHLPFPTWRWTVGGFPGLLTDSYLFVAQEGLIVHGLKKFCVFVARWLQWLRCWLPPGSRCVVEWWSAYGVRQIQRIHKDGKVFVTSSFFAPSSDARSP